MHMEHMHWIVRICFLPLYTVSIFCLNYSPHLSVSNIPIHTTDLKLMTAKFYTTLNIAHLISFWGPTLIAAFTRDKGVYWTLWPLLQSPSSFIRRFSHVMLNEFVKYNFSSEIGVFYPADTWCIICKYARITVYVLFCPQYLLIRSAYMDYNI